MPISHNNNNYGDFCANDNDNDTTNYFIPFAHACWLINVHPVTKNCCCRPHL